MSENHLLQFLSFHVFNEPFHDGEVAQWGKMTATAPGALCLIPGFHLVEVEY